VRSGLVGRRELFIRVRVEGLVVKAGVEGCFSSSSSSSSSSLSAEAEGVGGAGVFRKTIW
jgi:hypothetical protein